MEKERRKFSREFKLNAVELSYSRASIRELAHELDVRPELIYRWRSEFANYQGTSFPGNGKAKFTEEESELYRLKKELAINVSNNFFIGLGCFWLSVNKKCKNGEFLHFFIFFSKGLSLYLSCQFSQVDRELNLVDRHISF